MAQKEHFSLRLAATILRRLSEQAVSRGASKTSLAETYLREGVAMEDHPGLLFREGPAGRRPRLLGGPDVWEVIETFLDEGRDVDSTARYLDVPAASVRVAVGYYAEHQSDIDDWIAANAAEAEHAEAAWRRRQALTG